MKVQELVDWWQRTAHGRLSPERYAIHVPIEVAAKIEALAEMYPRRSREGLISDLLSAALQDLEGSLPYIKGKRVVAEDEFGDPLYEDAGPTPRFIALSRKHLKSMRASERGRH